MKRKSTEKSLVWAVLLSLLALSGWCARMAIDLHVIDAVTGEPLAGALAQGRFYAHTGWVSGRGADTYYVTAVTDSNGYCRVRGESPVGSASVWVEKAPAGYYTNRRCVKYESEGKTRFGHWLPKSVDRTIPLQKIGKRIPLAERGPRLWLDGNSTAPQKEPEDGYTVTAAYDLFEGAWMPPHGQGKVADIVFTSEYRLLSAETHVIRGKSETLKSYAWRHTVHVPGKGNGIRAMHPDPLFPVRLRTGVDEGLVGSLSRERRYELTFDGTNWLGDYSGESQDPDVVYALRLRSEFDESGRLKKAYYARIDGPLDVQPECPEKDIMCITFRGYLNPLANDKNLEPDNLKNLNREAVRALAKKTHVDVSVPEHNPEAAAGLVQAAIDECSRGGGGEICIGPGEIEMAPLVLRDGITLYLEKGTTLLASTNVSHYAAHRAFISAEDAVDVGIRGEGVVDGRGAAFPAGEGLPSGAPDLVRFARCTKLQMEGCLLRNVAARGVVLLSCDGAVIQRVKYFNHVNPLKEGLRIASRNVRIEECEFDTAGDAIVLKSDAEAAADCREIGIYGSTIRSHGNALRLEARKNEQWRGIKLFSSKLCRSLQEMTNAPLRSAAVEVEVADGGRLECCSILFCDMRMGDQTPFALRMRRSDPQSGQTPVMRHIFISNLKGRTESRVACSILGLPDARPKDISLHDIALTFADGDSGEGPPASDASPAWGLYVCHADAVNKYRLDLKLDRTDERPPIVMHDVK